MGRFILVHEFGCSFHGCLSSGTSGWWQRQTAEWRHKKGAVQDRATRDTAPVTYFLQLVSTSQSSHHLQKIEPSAENKVFNTWGRVWWFVFKPLHGKMVACPKNIYRYFVLFCLLLNYFFKKRVFPFTHLLQLLLLLMPDLYAPSFTFLSLSFGLWMGSPKWVPQEVLDDLVKKKKDHVTSRNITNYLHCVFVLCLFINTHTHLYEQFT